MTENQTIWISEAELASVIASPKTLPVALRKLDPACQRSQERGMAMGGSGGKEITAAGVQTLLDRGLITLKPQPSESHSFTAELANGSAFLKQYDLKLPE